jgi:glucose 1-dehydrogenase
MTSPRDTSAGISGQVCIVTGGASGIGRATCRKLTELGASVVIADVDDEGGRRIQDELDASGVPSSFVRTDVSVEREVRQLVETTCSRHGPPSILVHAAAAMTFSPVIETSQEEWDRVFAVNVGAAFLLAKHVLPAMLPGAIVNISSVHAHRTTAGVVPYAASKGALEAFTRGLSVEAAERAVRVNCLAPGGVDTPLLWANPHLPKDRSQVDAASPEEIAAAVVMLASPAAARITGATLVIDNGLLARL